MNLLFSYSQKDDAAFDAQGHRFLGAGKDSNDEEVHVFLHKDESLSSPPTAHSAKIAGTLMFTKHGLTEKDFTFGTYFSNPSVRITVSDASLSASLLAWFANSTGSERTEFDELFLFNDLSFITFEDDTFLFSYSTYKSLVNNSLVAINLDGSSLTYSNFERTLRKQDFSLTQGDNGPIVSITFNSVMPFARREHLKSIIHFEGIYTLVGVTKVWSIAATADGPYTYLFACSQVLQYQPRIQDISPDDLTVVTDEPAVKAPESDEDRNYRICAEFSKKLGKGYKVSVYDHYSHAKVRVTNSETGVTIELLMPESLEHKDAWHLVYQGFSAAHQAYNKGIAEGLRLAEERIAAHNKKSFFHPPSGQELRVAFNRSFGVED